MFIVQNRYLPTPLAEFGNLTAGNPPFVGQAVTRAPRSSAAFALQSRRRFQQLPFVPTPITALGETPGNPPFTGQAVNRAPKINALTLQQSRRRYRQEDPSFVPIVDKGLLAGFSPYQGTGITNPPNRRTAEWANRNKRKNVQSGPNVAGVPIYSGPIPWFLPLTGQSEPPRVNLRRLFAQQRRYRQMPSDQIVFALGLSAGLPPIGGQRAMRAGERLQGLFPARVRGRYRQSDSIATVLSGLSSGLPPFPSSKTPPRYSLSDALRNRRRYRQSDPVPNVLPGKGLTPMLLVGTAVRPRVPYVFALESARHYRQTAVLPVLAPGVAAGRPLIPGQTLGTPPRRQTGEYFARVKRPNRQMGVWPAIELGQSPGKPPFAYLSLIPPRRREIRYRPRFRQVEVWPALENGLSPGKPPVAGHAWTCGLNRLGREFWSRAARRFRQSQTLPSGLNAGLPPVSGAVFLQRPPVVRLKRRYRQFDPTPVLGPRLSGGYPQYVGQAITRRVRPDIRTTKRRYRQSDVLPSSKSAGRPLVPYPSWSLPRQRNTGNGKFSRRFRQPDVLPVLEKGLTAGHPPFSGANVPPRISTRSLSLQKRRFRTGENVVATGPALLPPSLALKLLLRQITTIQLWRLKRRYRQMEAWPALEGGRTAGSPPKSGQVGKQRISGEFVRRIKRRNLQCTQGPWPATFFPPPTPTEGIAVSFGQCLDGAESFGVSLDGAESFQSLG